MTFPSLLSEHEQKAFSVFLGQLAEEERAKSHSQQAQPHIPLGSDYQQQHGHDNRNDRLSPQTPNHLQLNPILSSQHGPSSPSRIRSVPSDLPLSTIPQHQQREWMQQLSANPLLAPGGVLDPQVMSQAFLQNPELMAQASAISQAMALAQQQQQQMQFQQIHTQEQMVHQQNNSNTKPHLHEAHSQDLHPQPHHYQSHSPPEIHTSYQQQRSHQQHTAQSSFHNGYPDQSRTMGIDPVPDTSSGSVRTIKKRKSQTNIHGGHTSRSSGTPPPLPSNVSAIHNPTSPSYVSTSPNGYHESDQMAYFDQGEESTPPSKKLTRRKESSGSDYLYPSSSPRHKINQRSSHDGHDSGYSAGGITARQKTGETSYIMGGRGSAESSEEVVYSKDPINYQHQQSPYNTTVTTAAATNTINNNSNNSNSNKYYSNGLSMTYPNGQITEGDGVMLLKHSNSSINNRPLYIDDKDDPLWVQSRQHMLTSQTFSRGSGKRQPHELLTEAEKKANHIASEQKRRQNIRIGFDSLVEIVPTLSECQRSEALILQKSVDYIQRLLDQKSELKNRVRDLRVNLGEPVDGDDSASEMDYEE
ncbi:hypothetical protein FBU30_006871 [Linnemannia zychae]|nr:hypothetical protein FBU30_006871 [Linnemannia zychae]